MEAVPGYRACYECPCGAYRWQRSAWSKGETSCLQCGTDFSQVPLRFYRKAKATGGARQTSSAAGQQYLGQWPKGGVGNPRVAKGAGKGARGPKGGGLTTRPGPQQPGLLQTRSATNPRDGRGAAGGQGSPQGINYNRASRDALYRARTHYEVMCGLWGDGSTYAQEAKAALDQASRAALDQQPPEKKLAALRSEHQQLLNSVSQGLQRCDQIEVQALQLNQEYINLEEAMAQKLQRAHEVQTEIDTYEADMPTGVPSGAQVGIRDQLHNLLQAHVRRSGKEFSDTQRQRTCDTIETLLRVFEDAGGEYDQMEEDSLPPLSEDERAERAPKQPRSSVKGEENPPEEAAEDSEWERGLGAMGKKLVKRGLLGKRTALQLGAQQTGQGGKAKGKTTSGKGKGKGKPITYSAALQAPPPPTATVSPAPPPEQGGLAASSSTGQPGVAISPGGVVPAGGNLTGGWPQLGAVAAAAGPAAQAPIDALGYDAQQAQLRRGEGYT